MVEKVAPSGRAKGKPEPWFKFRYTLVIEYEGKLSDYDGADTAEEMAAMDLDSVKNGYLSPYDLVPNEQPTVERIEVLR